MKNLFFAIIILVSTLTTTFAQSTSVNTDKKPLIKYTLKTNPVSIATARFNVFLEQTLNNKTTIEYGLGYRRQGWGLVSHTRRHGNATLRMKRYLLGESQNGFYIATGLSFEAGAVNYVREAKSSSEDLMVGALYIDAGCQLMVRKTALEIFGGAGLMTEKLSSNQYGESMKLYSSHIGFSDQVIFRMGMRVGISK